MTRATVFQAGASALTVGTLPWDAAGIGVWVYSSLIGVPDFAQLIVGPCLLTAVYLLRSYLNPARPAKGGIWLTSCFVLAIWMLQTLYAIDVDRFDDYLTQYVAFERPSLEYIITIWWLTSFGVSLLGVFLDGDERYDGPTFLLRRQRSYFRH